MRARIPDVLGLIGNFGWGETLITVVIAVLIFGKNLPQVAGKLFGHVRRARQAVDALRRETGIDRDFHDIGRTMRDVEYEAKATPPPGIPAPPSAPDYVRHLGREPVLDPIGPKLPHERTSPVNDESVSAEGNPSEEAEPENTEGADDPRPGQ